MRSRDRLPDRVILLHAGDTPALKAAAAKNPANWKRALTALDDAGSELFRRSSHHAPVALGRAATAPRSKPCTVLAHRPVALTIVRVAARQSRSRCDRFTRAERRPGISAGQRLPQGCGDRSRPRAGRQTPICEHETCDVSRGWNESFTGLGAVPVERGFARIGSCHCPLGRSAARHRAGRCRADTGGGGTTDATGDQTSHPDRRSRSRAVRRGRRRRDDRRQDRPPRRDHSR